MRTVVQRVASARVTVDDRVVGAIGRGVLVFLGIGADDAEADARWLLDKLLDLRIFGNAAGKFDRSVYEVKGELLVVPQFTLYADTRKGRRPSFTEAARPEHAVPLYEGFVAAARARGMRVATGEFGAYMHVELINDGPVTITLDSRTR